MLVSERAFRGHFLSLEACRMLLGTVRRFCLVYTLVNIKMVFS